MTKSEVIDSLVRKQSQLGFKDVEMSVKVILDSMTNALSEGDRVEIRGFGSFSLHRHEARVGRNPKTGESVQLQQRFVPHFKPGKDLRDRVNEGMAKYPVKD